MNPVTSFLVFACMAAGVAAGYFGHLYVGVGCFAVAAVIALSLKMANVWQKFVILRIIASPRNLYDRLVGRDDAAENDIDIDDPFAADETHCHPTAIFHAVHHGDDALFKRRVRSSKALASGWNKWQRYRITIELIAGGE